MYNKWEVQFLRVREERSMHSASKLQKFAFDHRTNQQSVQNVVKIKDFYSLSYHVHLQRNGASETSLSGWTSLVIKRWPPNLLDLSLKGCYHALVVSWSHAETSLCLNATKTSSFIKTLEDTNKLRSTLFTKLKPAVCGKRSIATYWYIFILSLETNCVAQLLMTCNNTWYISRTKYTHLVSVRPRSLHFRLILRTAARYSILARLIKNAFAKSLSIIYGYSTICCGTRPADGSTKFVSLKNHPFYW